MVAIRRLGFGILCLWLLSARSTRADDWPQWLGPNRDSVWRESGLVEKFSSGGPPIRWRANIGAGYSGPVVTHGRVYVTDRRVTSSEAADSNPAQHRTNSVERVLCLNEADGRTLWQHEYEC